MKNKTQLNWLIFLSFISKIHSSTQKIQNTHQLEIQKSSNFGKKLLISSFVPLGAFAVLNGSQDDKSGKKNMDSLDESMESKSTKDSINNSMISEELDSSTDSSKKNLLNEQELQTKILKEKELKETEEKEVKDLMDILKTTFKNNEYIDNNGFIKDDALKNTFNVIDDNLQRMRNLSLKFKTISPKTRMLFQSILSDWAYLSDKKKIPLFDFISNYKTFLENLEKNNFNDFETIEHIKIARMFFTILNTSDSSKINYFSSVLEKFKTKDKQNFNRLIKQITSIRKFFFKINKIENETKNKLKEIEKTLSKNSSFQMYVKELTNRKSRTEIKVEINEEVVKLQKEYDSIFQTVKSLQLPTMDNLNGFLGKVKTQVNNIK